MSSQNEPLAFIDLRPVADAGVPLSDTVIPALETLSRDGVLKLLARQRPDDLMQQLAADGYRVQARLAQRCAWDIEIMDADALDITDLRALEAPGPLQQVLLAVSRLEADQTYLARVPCVPHPLFALLEERSFRWWVHEEADHSALIAVQRAH